LPRLCCLIRRGKVDFGAGGFRRISVAGEF
jgi:hypothetical protein